jgi:hypothetical protein
MKRIAKKKPAAALTKKKKSVVLKVAGPTVIHSVLSTVDED